MIEHAILGPGASEDEVDAFVEALVGERRHGGHENQKVHGKWAKGIISTVEDPANVSKKTGVFLTDDPTKLGNLPADYRADMNRVIAGQFPGMTQEKMEANLRGTLDRALADPAVAGQKDWYTNARTEAVSRISDQYGYTPQQAIGAVAGMSPQHVWGSNLVTAEYTAKLLKTNPEVRLSPEEYWTAAEQLGKRGIAMPDIYGKRLGDFDNPYIQAALIKGMGKDAGLTYVDDLTGKVNRCSWSCGLDGQVAGIRVLKGESPNDVLTGHKVRSFNNDITMPGGYHGSVTIDTHALSAAVGEKVPASDTRQKVLTTPARIDYGSGGAYAVFADAYRNVAAEYNLSPDQAQALIWLQWRKENP